jgi:hypothetical protein
MPVQRSISKARGARGPTAAQQSEIGSWRKGFNICTLKSEIQKGGKGGSQESFHPYAFQSYRREKEVKYMATVPDKIQTWQMVQPTSKEAPGKLEKTSIPVPSLGPGEVLVEVAGCGVCHTDLGYFYDGVPTVQKPPLTLGHEISGTVVAGDQKWVGKEVIIPAVMPCRQCLLSRAAGGRVAWPRRCPEIAWVFMAVSPVISLCLPSTSAR